MFSASKMEKYSLQFYWDGEMQLSVLLGRRNTVYSSTGMDKYMFTVLLARRIVVFSSTGTEKYAHIKVVVAFSVVNVLVCFVITRHHGVRVA